MDVKKSKNSNLNKAGVAKNDEFYTQLEDVEREIKHYKEYFKNKVVFCNCDDPEWSAFWRYFSENFEHLGLKKLISTHYKAGEKTYKLEIIEDINGDGKINKLDVIKTELDGDGDFRSDECLQILKESDVVVTNPPFSLFREYVAQLIEYKKEFLIIGSQNAITYKEFFPLLKGNKIWMGQTKPKDFKQPDGSYKKFGNICWFTNLLNKKRTEEIILFKRYKDNINDYPEYEYYNAINIDALKDIPLDYSGVMGVPITFIEKYNPNQFDIIDANDYRKSNNVPIKKHGLIKDKDALVGEKIKYARILIKNKKVDNGN